MISKNLFTVTVKRYGFGLHFYDQWLVRLNLLFDVLIETAELQITVQIHNFVSQIRSQEIKSSDTPSLEKYQTYNECFSTVSMFLLLPLYELILAE